MNTRNTLCYSPARIPKTTVSLTGSSGGIFLIAHHLRPVGGRDSFRHQRGVLAGVPW